MSDKPENSTKASAETIHWIYCKNCGCPNKIPKVFGDPNDKESKA